MKAWALTQGKLSRPAGRHLPVKAPSEAVSTERGISFTAVSDLASLALTVPIRHLAPESVKRINKTVNGEYTQHTAGTQ